MRNYLNLVTVLPSLPLVAKVSSLSLTDFHSHIICIDSTVLAYVIKLLNDRHNYQLDLVLLSVDEGITGYRDDSLATVERNKTQYGLPLTIVSYASLYNGWTMDRIVAKIGRKNNCTFCGVFRRQALDRGAAMLHVDQILTGHNADDMAETVLMNILRGDIARLRRCTDITTGELPGANSCASPHNAQDEDGEMAKVVRSKPFKSAFEKEIVMYAYFKKLDYFSTECIYAPNAYRGFARAFLKDLEAIKPKAILDIIRSGEAFELRADVRRKEQITCQRCGYIASNRLCKACVLLEGLEADNSTGANKL
jgi:cytoplasmic tRNA 2-thiolation protein 1